MPYMSLKTNATNSKISKSKITGQIENCIFIFASFLFWLDRTFIDEQAEFEFIENTTIPHLNISNAYTLCGSDNEQKVRTLTIDHIFKQRIDNTKSSNKHKANKFFKGKTHERSVYGTFLLPLMPVDAWAG